MVGYTGTWAEDEDTKLKISILLYEGKDGKNGSEWAAIATLVRD
jgi:hypothetical protein